MTAGPFPRTSAHQASSRPAAAHCHRAGVRRVSSSATAPRASSPYRVSGQMADSSMICRESNRVGAAASTAAQAGRPQWRSTAYTMAAVATPIRCWTVVTSSRLWKGASSHSSTG